MIRKVLTSAFAFLITLTVFSQSSGNTALPYNNPDSVTYLWFNTINSLTDVGSETGNFGPSKAFNSTALNSGWATVYASKELGDAGYYPYVGIDFKTARVISQVQYVPRNGYGARMTGNIVQGTNDTTNNWSAAVTIYTIPTVGNNAGWSGWKTITKTVPYRFFRIVSQWLDTTSFSNSQYYNCYIGDFNFATPIESTTPVTFGKLSATTSAKSVLLKWNTLTEANSATFVIERSADGKNYASIDTLAAAVNSNKEIDYSYTDETPLTGTNYYRIKEVDLDGKATYSNQATAVVKGTGVISIYPNPIKKGGLITVTSLSPVTVKVTSLSGKLVASKQTTGTTTIGTSGLMAGLYFVTVYDGVGKLISTSKVVVE